MKLAKRMGRIQSSATVAMTEAASRRRAEGLETYSLSVGEPDFDTPAHIRDAAIDAINSGKTRYTASDGIVELKSAIANKLDADFNLHYEHDEIIVTSGGKMAIFEALLASVEAGDEVIIVAPYWVSYPDIVRFAGAKPVVIHAKQDNNYELPVQDIEAAINEKTRWLILNSPNNPTGAVINAQSYLALSRIMDAHPQMQILSDDIYEYLTYSDDDAPAHFLRTMPAFKDRVLIVNGVSKSYAMTGWRIGYAAGNQAIIKAMRILQAQSTNNPSSVAQFAALAALNGPQDFLVDWKEHYRERRDFVMNQLKNMNGLVASMPQGAFYILVNIEAYLGGDYANDVEFAAALLQDFGVATVPGSAFGANGSIRISYANNIEYLGKAINKMRDFIQTIDTTL